MKQPMNLVVKKKNSCDKLLLFICAQLICLSGSLFYYLQMPSFALLFWVLSCFYYWRKFGNGNNVIKSNAFMWIAWIFWIFFCSFVVHSKPIDNEVYTVCLFPLGSLLLNSSVSFSKFRAAMLIVSRWIFGISIVVHLLHSFHLLGASYISFSNGGAVMSLLIFHTEWGTISTPFGDVYRFSSIFWEAGQCQIVVFFILLLFTDDLKDNLLKYKYILRKYGVLLLAMMLTGSTTGYMVFGIYISSLILFSSIAKKYKVLYPFFILVALGVGIIFYNSPVIQEKLAQSSEASENTSYAIRMMDNMACLRAALENKLFGLGYNTPIMNKTLSNYGSITSANGFFRAAAALGIYFVLAMWFLLWKGIIRMKLGLPGFILVSCLIFSQGNEYFIFFPYMFMYIFGFKSYV